jgi:signal transduction histidine kinase
MTPTRIECFEDMPIRSKLRAICLGVSGTVLLGTFAVFLTVQRVSTWSEQARQAHVLAQVVGDQSSAALEFEQREAAVGILAPLRAEPHIVFAAIYGPDGRLFASYTREGAEPPSAQQAHPDGERELDGHLEVYQPLLSAGERIGTFALRSDMGEVAERFRLSLFVMVALLCAAAVAIPVLAGWLGNALTRPVIDLERVVDAVRTEGDYGKRAPLHGRDELGRLVAGFNHMLSEIQLRDSALARVNDELEERVHARTAELEASNRDLESFSYSVSHDLRAPLRAIDGFGEVLVERFSDTLDPDARRYVDRMRAASRRMAELIEGLLELARISRAEIRHEPIDLSALARDLLQDLAQSEPDRHVEIEVASGLESKGDPALVRAALGNLLDNAWKYTRKQEQPRIEFGRELHEGQPVYFVRDNGAGFDMTYASKLFGVFQRLHSDAQFQGTGIGLASVRRTLERHGGRIWAEAAEGEGATFYFTL